MTLDEENKILFIHIPKTGGTSITKFLTGEMSGKKINTDGDTHFSISKARKFISLNYDDYYKFMVIRNPWDYYVSLYEFAKSGNCHEWRLFKPRDDSFKTWLKNIVNCHIDNRTIEKFKDDNTSTASLYKFLQYSNLDCGWLTHRYIYSGCLTWQNIFKNYSIDDFVKKENELFSLNDVLTTENLEDDFVKLLLRNSVNENIVRSFKNYRHHNKNKNRKSYKDYYDSDTKELVEVKDRFIIEKFGYEF